MSASICGKRVGFEDIFGSPSTTSQAPSTKRSRGYPLGSPTRCSDLGFGSEDKLSILFRMFPSLDREVVESILDSHDHNIDDAIKSLHALCIGNDCGEAVSCNPTILSNTDLLEGQIRNPATEQAAIGDQDENLENFSVSLNGSSLVDLFVQEMRSASDWEDIRVLTSNLLEVFERTVIANCSKPKEQEVTLLKDQLLCLLKDSHVLKKGIQIQHERALEQEERLKEVPQLQHFISQCQEQIRKLEVLQATIIATLLQENFVQSHNHILETKGCKRPYEISAYSLTNWNEGPKSRDWFVIPDAFCWEISLVRSMVLNIPSYIDNNP